MLRVAAALAATAAGLITLLSFKSHAGAPPLIVTAPAAAQSNTAPGGSSAKGGKGSGSYTGAASNTPYGPVQVRVSVAAGKVTGVTVVQVPENDGYEMQIVSIALPQLKSEVLSAQSASINAVSGATYTSQGYAQSLQSALDQAGIK